MAGEPICVVCEADGIVSVNDAWYCVAHVDEAFLFISRVLAHYAGWDEDETEEELREWIDSPPTNQQGESNETTVYSDRSSDPGDPGGRPLEL